MQQAAARRSRDDKTAILVVHALRPDSGEDGYRGLALKPQQLQQLQ